MFNADSRQTIEFRLVDDLERRINTLIDALNCETLSKPVVEQLVLLTGGVSCLLMPSSLPGCADHFFRSYGGP